MELDLKSERRIYEAGIRPSAEIGLALITRLEQAEEDRVKLRNRLDAMRRQRDGYRNQLRKARTNKETTMSNQPPLNPDELAHAKAAAVDCRINGGSTEDVAECAVEAYLAVAQPEVLANSKPNQNLEFAQPVVNSVEELDKLPMHSYVQGNDGFKHAKDWNGGWHLIVNRPSSAPHLSGSIELPARVLYRPESS